MREEIHLGHVNLLSKDPQQAARFYREVLGLQMSLEGSIPALGTSSSSAATPMTRSR
jgi:catechol-2,3-dioxygenase